jgi:hypothetical protein
MVAIPTGALEGLGQYMFALGHKQTFRSAIVMSALPRKTDILCAERNVR